jgi:hypothetical protein
MGDTWIVDMTHYLMADGMLAEGPWAGIARHFGAIASAASLQKTGIWVDTALRCRRRPGRRPCPGHIRLFRTDIPSRIEWHCTSCDDDGWISNWEGTIWDLSPSGKES